MTHPEMFCALVAGHCVADYPLQGDFLARAKNHVSPIPGISPTIALAAHSIIHGATVSLITSSFALGIAETIVHAFIDYQKCAGRTNFVVDQFLHVLCKAAWVLILSLQ